jgi:phospholipid/cholesterol/gamma-HCH transport system substrate-binding protein
MSLLAGHDRDLELLVRGTRRFILIGVLLVIAVVTLILVKQGLFRPTVPLGFVADSAHDISKGTAVKVAGFRVGSITDIVLRPDGKVDVAIEVDADQMRFVTKDAIAELRKEGLVGAATIEIVPGADRSQLAAAEAKLTFSRSEGLTAMANQLRAEILPIIRDVKAITGTIADPKSGLPATLAQLRETSTSINTLLATSNQQVGELGGSAQRLLGKAEEDLAHLGRTLETTNARLPGLLDKTEKTLQHVERISAEAESTVPATLRDGSAVAADVREIVGGAKQAWPIRNLVTPPGPSQLRPDSDPHAEGGRAATP